MKKTFLVCVIILTLLPLAWSQPNSNFNVSLTIVGESCFDGVQNQDETGVDCGGVCEACDTDDGGSSGGGSGGGGGGGGAVVTPPEKKDTFRKYYFQIKENETIVNEFNKSKLAVYRVEFKFLNTVNNVTFEIKNTDKDLPVEEQNLSEHNYQYFKISASNVKLTDIDYVKMWFKVEDVWLTKKNTIEEVVMLNYKDTWQTVPTVYISNSTGYFYFRSTSDTYGYFAIVGKEPKPVSEEPEPTTENPLKKFIPQFQRPEDPVLPEGYLTYLLYGIATVSLLGAGIIVAKKTKDFKLPTFSHDNNISKMKSKISDYEKRIDMIDEKIKNL